MSDDRKSVCSIHEQAYVGRCPYCVEPEAPPEKLQYLGIPVVDVARQKNEHLGSIWRVWINPRIATPPWRIGPIPESDLSPRDAAAPEEDG